MTPDLKALAIAARDAPYHDPYAYRLAWDAFEAAASPAAVLTLMDRIELLSGVVESLMHTLPMAKAYAAEHPVGNNASIVLCADEAMQRLAEDAQP